MAWENAGDDRHAPRKHWTGDRTYTLDRPPDRIGVATRLVGLILAVCLSAAVLAFVAIGLARLAG